jgi:hypothetical protein
MEEKELAEMVSNSRLLFYGEMDSFLGDYLKDFFSREIRDVGFSDDNSINNVTWWFCISWLVSIDCIEYGTSPRGGWLTEKGEALKKYVLENENPIEKLIEIDQQFN